ncbi:MAG: hypothetical protein Q9220_005801 [cf. Caloplaca sp. 1 TL-2023]
MSQILAVFGATGQQGSSIINYVLNDPELSQRYKLRAISRDVDSEKAKKLREQKVEVVQGDAFDRASLQTALTGVHTVFAMTTPAFGPDGFEIEYNSAKTIADVAVEKGVSYIIFSTLPPTKEISGGKYTKVTPFDAKAAAEKYIRSLDIKSAFYSPGAFMENFLSYPFMRPRQQNGPDDDWILTLHTSPQSKVAAVDCVGDTGKFIGAILAEPDKYEGKTFCAATAYYSWDEVATIMSKASGKKVIYKQVPVEEFKEIVPFAADVFAEGFSAWEEFGYWGPDSEKLVAWAVENARGKLTTLEEYFQAHPLQLV